MEEFIVTFKDGGIVEFDTGDSESYGGCETCDFGSSYIDDFGFTLSNNRKVNFEVSQMYEHAVSTGDLMKTLLPNIEMFKTLTEDEFVKWLEKSLTDNARSNCADFKCEVTYTKG